MASFPNRLAPSIQGLSVPMHRSCRLATIAISASDAVSAPRYLEVVQHLGATATLVVPGGNASLQHADGLLLTGGPDIDPDLYGKATDPKAGPTNRERDDLELFLLRDALQRNMPVLGICRGMQLINVAVGGTLIQDITGHRVVGEDGKWESAYHQVDVPLGTELAAILGGAGLLEVNSRHHQGLRDFQKAPSLLASAYSPEDGFIEALESPAHDWVIGVQCHPERVDEVPSRWRRLFQVFVERSETFSQRRSGIIAS